ncbi:hypothetical protein AK812_SmicGene44114 [Symbiodinium microadriaticum]|uniref:Uncharacterized protein n=1 Tax=Symbiodinium microadriaticum TaxID=2951 RepID=A0A1Q9BZ99_SYMMI|nr:hypothetical protein AK812_SmicGene44114 [Symbiodinium microadriaticum]
MWRAKKVWLPGSWLQEHARPGRPDGNSTVDEDLLDAGDEADEVLERDGSKANSKPSGGKRKSKADSESRSPVTPFEPVIKESGHDFRETLGAASFLEEALAFAALAGRNALFFRLSFLKKASQQFCVSAWAPALEKGASSKLARSLMQMWLRSYQDHLQTRAQEQEFGDYLEFRMYWIQDKMEKQEYSRQTLAYGSKRQELFWLEAIHRP